MAVKRKFQPICLLRTAVLLVSRRNRLVVLRPSAVQLHFSGTANSRRNRLLSSTGVGLLLLVLWGIDVVVRDDLSFRNWIDDRDTTGGESRDDEAPFESMANPQEVVDGGDKVDVANVVCIWSSLSHSRGGAIGFASTGTTEGGWEFLRNDPWLNIMVPRQYDLLHE
ncbi:Uncharacterized protein Fot_03455 [Forsythia ovata]|uniref:Uncharacterized protein n=1 Tax=Forsythia ovata TaxID=205694 RepID=A0ABD1X9R0_9LAMI